MKSAWSSNGDDSINQLVTAWTCVSKGTFHQGNGNYLHPGVQCTAIAACAAVQSVINNRAILSTVDIDLVLHYGDLLYSKLKPERLDPRGYIHLAPDDLPDEVRVGPNLINIESLGNYLTKQGYYPSGEKNKSKAIERLHKILNEEVFDTDYDDSRDSFLFTGDSKTVSFWRSNGHFYLFNSHAVGNSGRYDDSDIKAARLFECNSLAALSKLLLIDCSCSGGLYVLNRIRVNDREFKPNSQTHSHFGSPSDFEESQSLLKNFVDREFKPNSQTHSHFGSPSDFEESQSLLKNFVDREFKPYSQTHSHFGSPSDFEESQSLFKNFVDFNENSTAITSNKSTAQPENCAKYPPLIPVVVVEKINDFKLTLLKPVVVIEPLATSANTTSNKKGRPTKRKQGRVSTNKNAHLDAVNKYNVLNPDVHCAAVKKYKKKNPEVQKTAQKKYTKSNPEVHRISQQKYNVQNPDVHREAVSRYDEQHPEINRVSVTKYNQISRNVDAPIRKSKNLIAEKRDNDLSVVKLFSLKNSNLNSPGTYECPHCHAKLFQEERSRQQWCCGQGAYNVLNLPPLTEDFYEHPLFLARPRAYNNAFSFSALGVSHGFRQPDGIAFLKIQGRTYHRVFDLAYDETPNNIRYYIADDTERERIAAGQNLDMQVIRCINNFLHNVNPFIECFKRLNSETSSESFLKFEKTSRATHGNILGDQPLGREIAAIISSDREEYSPRCIAIWKIGDKKPHTVDIFHPLYESFQFPLLYPEGNPGWTIGKNDNNGNKLSQAKYIRCLLLSEPRFSCFGRLSEEFLVDMYCRICEERLRYLYNMQSKNNNSNELRVAPLQELLNDETITAEGIVPGRIYLPNSYTGGPRYMKLKYLDCIALVNRLGPPSFFITLTCNPKWPEIKQSILPGRTADPLICARAFNLRLLALLRDIRSGQWFGRVEYLTYVIEFQKRGLPHAHICFRVEGGGPADSVDIDKMCRADIPDPAEAEGRLRKAVLEHMIHGPCGPPHRENLPCYDKEKRKCTKYFPKRETSVTFCDERGFINLRRDSKNEGVIRYRSHELKVSDLWVVPYNAALLLKYDAHINVEVSSQRSVIKYLFKYMTKGPDEARVAVVAEEHSNNEIENYVTKRYISSSDAAWRVLEFDVTSRIPNVKQLAVHLDGNQTVYFKRDKIQDAVNNTSSDLLVYFNRPPGDEFDSLTYAEFFEKYIVHTKRPTVKNVTVYELNRVNKFITPRQRGELVARLFWVAPNRGEQFYLRLLLNTFPCRSYTDLKNLGGPYCTTFQEAAKAVGLADDEVEYEKAMLEASTFFTGSRLRSFLVLLAVNGSPVASLWDKFKRYLSEDIAHRRPTDNKEIVYNLCLKEINKLLRKHGSSLVEHGLPDVSDNTTELDRERVEYDRKSLAGFVDVWLQRLSSEQRRVYDYVDRLCRDMEFRDTNTCAIFIDGPAGTGKTLLLNVITAHVRGNLNGIVLCTASSAIAAQNYDGGITAHSMFKYPLDLVDDQGYWSITNRTQRAELIYHSDVIIYDEAPMAHKYLIHLLDRSLRDLMSTDKIFGGKVIIFAGDFRQIPPVVCNARSNSDIINCSVKTSPLWPNLKTFSLRASQRCRDDSEYADFLLKLGCNELPSNTVQIGRGIQNLVQLDGIESVTEVGDLIDFVFPEVVVDEPEVCAHRAILCTRNDAVKEINTVILDRVPGELLHFYSIDKIDSEHADELFLGPDALNNLQPQGVPEHDLKLKEGSICMIIRNISFSDGLVNGTKVIVVATSPRLITVRKPGGSETFLIPRILFKAPIERNSPYEMVRRQFPLQVCYAMTIHKSQGQTIGRVGVDLRSDVFTHGQLYVALGRVRERRNIKILVHPDRVYDNKPVTNNVVIPELL